MITNYGYVVGLKGKHKDEVVYYDDDASRTKGIFYPGRFLPTDEGFEGYFVAPHRNFRPASVGEILMHEDMGNGLYSECRTLEVRPSMTSRQTCCWTIVLLVLDFMEGGKQLPLFEATTHAKVEATYPGLVERLFTEMQRQIEASVMPNGNFDLPRIIENLEPVVRAEFKKHKIPVTPLRNHFAQETFRQMWAAGWATAIQEWAKNLVPLYGVGDKVRVLVNDKLVSTKILEVLPQKATYIVEGFVQPLPWEEVEIATMSTDDN